MEEISEIVVAVDGSDSALRAARFAHGLSRVSGSPLTLLYVFPASPMDSAWVAALTADELARAREEAGRTVIQGVCEKLGLTESDVDGVIVSGDPAGEIIDYLSEGSGRMCVMGRRGRSGFGALLLGSVSDKVVRHAPGVVTLVS